MRSTILLGAVAALTAAFKDDGVPVKAGNGYARHDVSNGPVVVIDIPADDASEEGEGLARGGSVNVTGVLTVSVAYNATESMHDIEAMLDKAHDALVGDRPLESATQSLAYAGYDRTPPERDGDAVVATHTYAAGYRR